jgi:CheY-like chemotaxis protein
VNVAQPTTPIPGAPEPAPETYGAAELLMGLPIVAEDLVGLAEVRLGAAVAAALRAALDWLAGESGRARPLRARADDAALEIVLEHLDGRALRAAGEALAAVGGSLGRVESARPDAPWVVRVPTQAAREQYLMVIEGGLPVAFAWPAVIHIVMASSAELSAGLSAPRVPALVEGAGPAAGDTGAAEFPVVLLGLGLKRGYYVAERLVWRLPAVAIETVAPPPLAGLSHAVQTEEGDCYWVADPAWLLQSIEPPALEVPPASAWAPPPPPPVLADADVNMIELLPDEVEPLSAAAPRATEPPAPAAPAIAPPSPPEPATEASPPAAAPAPPQPEPVSEASAPAAAPLRPAATPPPAAAPPREAPATSPSAPPAAKPSGFRAALVAEDSITASIFLARLLEQQGFLVRTVDSAAELARELVRGDWSLVCVDVELPDGRGREHLTATREAHERAHAAHAGPSALVALVRDADDLAEAQAAGISRVLRKPFDRGALAQLLGRIGLRMGGMA